MVAPGPWRRRRGSRRAALLACIVAALVSLCASPAAAAAAAAATEPSLRQTEYSCDALDKVPAHLQCSFIREKCPAESLVPYAQVYFCYVAPHNVLLRGAYLLAVCCLLPLAFCLLGDTAEFYIAPIMAHVSQAIPKMRPRFAGVTFVALGNGAPDLSANIAAISAGEVVLSAGALTGAAMFVQCVVAAELVALAGDAGIKCGGAMLRDVGVYCLAILSVLLAFALGQITRAFVGWAIALYILYMVWVFAGDEWHQRGRPKPQLDPQAFRAALSRLASRNNTNNNRLPGAAQARRSSGATGSTAGLGSRGELEESLLPWVDAEAEEADAEAYFGGSFEGGYHSGHPAGVGRLLPVPSGYSLEGGGHPVGFAGAPAFEASVGAVSPYPVGGAGGGGEAVGGQLGSRPASFTGPSRQQQRSTELSFAPSSRTTPPLGHGGSASAAATPTGWHSGAGGNSRRVSEPASSSAASSRAATAMGAVAAAAASPVVAGWDGAPDGTMRHSSATLPGRSADLGGGFSHPTAVAGWATSPRQRRQQQQQQHAGGGGGASGLQRHGSAMAPHVVSLGNQSYIDPKTYKQLVWADLADDEEEEARLEREIARQLIGGGGGGGGGGRYARPAPVGSYQAPALSPGVSVEGGSPTAADHVEQQQQQALLSPAGSSPQHQQQQQPGSPDTEAGAYLSPFGSAGCRSGPGTPMAQGHSDPGQAAADKQRGLSGPDGYATGLQQRYTQQQQYMQQHQQQLGSLPEQPGSAGDTWQQLQWQVTLGNSEEWVEAGAVIRLFRKVTFPLLLPAYLGQRLTIPFASAAGYSREWLVVSLLCCPLALIAYLGALSLPGVLGACGAGIAAACLGALLTAWDAPGQMAAQGLGGRCAAVVPGLLAVLAFAMGVVWIDKVATEVVGIITFLAGLASLPDGVMGLTLLAWGNSLGDFFGNRAMARAGHTSTAITACFAAPLFNMLISLAAGFSSYLHKLGTPAVHVPLTPEVALGCVFLVGYNIAIIAVGHLCGQRLPPWFRHFARAWYALYFVLAVASGFYQQHHGDNNS